MKTEHLRVRLEFDEMDELERRCEELNVTKSEYVRMLIREALI